MKPDRFDHLMEALLEERLSAGEHQELQNLLKADPAHRRRYRLAMSLHSSLLRRSRTQPAYFDASGSPAAAPAPRRPFLWLVPAALVACAVLAFLLPRGPRAELLDASAAVWSPGSPAPTHGRIPAATPLELSSGFVRIGFPSGAQVTLEGPCRFRLDEKEALQVIHGRASIHTPDGAEGFRIDTPGGSFVDLGTEFGLAVGSDGTAPVILTEVFKGEVEVQAVSSTRLTSGQSGALVRQAGTPTLLEALDESPVMLVNHTRTTPSSSALPSNPNLALGKPVFSPGFCTRPHGSIFPPDNLTDGRLNDSGVPGDWSFWLAPDGKDGEFTVDLLEPSTISRISLQNTHNRGIGDRGTARFAIFASLDNQHFTPLLEGELPRPAPSAGGELPFHEFSFAPATARYVKVVVLSHYRHPGRPANHPCQGGGLNEIRIFAE